MKFRLTFKKSEKWLYDEIHKHSGKGAWIKDVLKQHLEKEKEKEKPCPETEYRKTK